MKIFFFGIIYFMLVQCTQFAEDDFQSKVLISSTGEKIFVNSINWGVTGDYQLTAISKDSIKLQNRSDSIGAISGFNPFIYRFKNDTLTLYFYKKIVYKITDHFNSISVVYKIVDSDEYLSLSEKTIENIEFYSIPEKKKISFPSDMPKPPR